MVVAVDIGELYPLAGLVVVLSYHDKDCKVIAVRSGDFNGFCLWTVYKRCSISFVI